MEDSVRPYWKLLVSASHLLGPLPFPEALEAGGIWDSEFFRNSEASRMHLLHLTDPSNTDLSAA